MNKSCRNCYWKHTTKNYCIWNDIQLDDKCCNICDEYKYSCDCGDEAKYEYHGSYYCEDCILKNLDIKTVEIKEYYSENGEYLGNENDDIDTIIDKVTYEVNILEEE